MEKTRLIEEFKISIFGTSIVGFVASFIFSNNVFPYLLLIIFSISTISFFISIVTDKINDKYNNYKWKKEFSIIDKHYKDDLIRYSAKESGSVPKNTDYYSTLFLVKITFYFYLILVLPFYLWHQFAQEFEKPYRKIFN